MENLLQGMELVEESTAWEVSIFGGLAICVCVIGIIMLHATIFAIALGTVEVKKPVNRVALISISAILFFIGWVGEEYDEKTHSIPQYKVTISDEVSMNEFMDHYVIVDKDGAIYTIREKSTEGK